MWKDKTSKGKTTRNSAHYNFTCHWYLCEVRKPFDDVRVVVGSDETEPDARQQLG